MNDISDVSTFDFQPLDIILFSGRNYFSKLIQFCQKQQITLYKKEDHSDTDDVTKEIPKRYRYSHCGIVLSESMIPPKYHPDQKKLYIFESTFGGPKDIQGKQTFGVQIRDLIQVLNDKSHDNIEISVIRLKVMNNPIEREILLKDDVVIHKIMEFVNATVGLPYPLNAFKMVGAFHKHFRKILNLTPLSSGIKLFKTYFCSQLIAALLKHLGILPDYSDPKSVLPADLCGFDIDSESEGGIPLITDISSYKILSHHS